MLRKIKFLVFLFLIQILVATFYFTNLAFSQSVSCSPCSTDKCECSIPQGISFQPTTFGIYESQDCSGNPLFYWKVENGKAVWKPEKSGNYYIRFFADYKSSQCFSISVEEQDKTPPTTTVSIQDLGNGNYKATFSCSDDKSGCDKTFYCFGTGISDVNLCNPATEVKDPLTFSCSSCCYIRYYSIDKAGNKENMKLTSFGTQCSTFCRRVDPTLSASPTSQKGKAGEEKKYSLVIANNDNEGCGISVFKISIECLANFECKLDESEKKIDPQKSATVTISIKPSSNVQPGKYRFKVNVEQINPQRKVFIEIEYQVVEEDTTPPSTSTTVQPGESPDWIKVIFSCTDDKSGCDKTCFQTDNSPEKCFSWPTNENFIKLPTAVCEEIKYYSIDKAGNKENMKLTKVGKGCECKEYEYWDVSNGKCVCIDSGCDNVCRRNNRGGGHCGKEGTYQYQYEDNCYCEKEGLGPTTTTTTLPQQCKEYEYWSPAEGKCVCRDEACDDVCRKANRGGGSCGQWGSYQYQYEDNCYCEKEGPTTTTTTLPMCKREGESCNKNEECCENLICENGKCLKSPFNLAVTDIKIIDGIVFYKVKNSGNREVPPTCSAIFIGYKDVDGKYYEKEVDAVDYVDRLDVGEERWEAFEEEESKKEIDEIVKSICSVYPTLTVKVVANGVVCGQYGVKERVRESISHDNNFSKELECSQFCHPYEIYSQKEGCRCTAEKCKTWYSKEGIEGGCIDNQCKPSKNFADFVALGVFFNKSDIVWYCYGNRGYEEIGVFSVEIYENDKKVYSYPPSPIYSFDIVAHGIRCRDTDVRVNKNAVYNLTFPRYESYRDVDKTNNQWKGQATSLDSFIERNLKMNLPSFIYTEAWTTKVITPLRGNKWPFEPFIFDVLPLGAAVGPVGRRWAIFEIDYQFPTYENLKFSCFRPHSGRVRLCSKTSAWRDFCLPEIEYACLSSPPPVAKARVFQPVSCSFSLGKESFCFFNGKCEKGLWIILNKEGNPLTYPIVKSLSPSLTIPSSALKSKGKVKAIAICFQPEVKIFSSTFEVA